MPAVTPIHDHAAGQLRTIRALMERAGSYTAVPAWGGILMGSVGVVASVVAARAGDRQEATLVWLVAAGIALPLGAAAMIAAARAGAVAPASRVARRFVLALGTPVIAGGVLTAALLQRGELDLLPAVWLLGYGTAAVVAGQVSVPVVSAMGAGFLGLGTVAAFAPVGILDWILGAGFGALHLIAGVAVLRAPRDGDVDEQEGSSQT